MLSLSWLSNAFFLSLSTLALASPASSSASSSIASGPPDSTYTSTLPSRTTRIPVPTHPVLPPSPSPLSSSSSTPPTVHLDNATITGFTSSRSAKFLGIPYALPPIGQLRFALPQPNKPYTNNFDAKSFGLSCPQQDVDLPIVSGLGGDAINYIVNTIYGFIFPDSEDCLTLNVVKPANATPKSKLPVVVWFFGGGFELGGTSLYDGATIVERSIDMGQPVVYVSMNYRVSAFGFLASKEVKAAGVGNLGLQDQRQALRWIQKYISSFGGDPSKVTIWGESAGAISVSLQMLSSTSTSGSPSESPALFRAAFMQSGSPIPVGDIEHGQRYYDAIVRDVGCDNEGDTLACLRGVEYVKLRGAMNRSPGIFSYQSLSLAWLPRVDGVFLSDNPQKMARDGRVVRVPYVTGDCDDEGTLFSLANLNVTTDAQTHTYIQTYFLPSAPSSSISTLLSSQSGYTSDITTGSPFDTSVFNALTPQFKRLAAFQGDAVFQAPRRWFLRQTVGRGTQSAWAFLSKRLKLLPFLGAFHASDLLNVYDPLGDSDMAGYLINFVNTLDPNGDSDSSGDLDYWPQYKTDVDGGGERQMLVFRDSLFDLEPREVVGDTFRRGEMEGLMGVMLEYPL